MKIKFNDLGSQWKEIKNDCLPRIERILEVGNFILGEELKQFEENFKNWNKNKFAIGVANGTDALVMAVDSLDLQGSSLFYIPANTYIATLLGVVLSKNKSHEYKLIDCDIYYQMDMNILEKELGNDSKKYQNLVVMPVHLYGSCCDMKKLLELKNKFGFTVIEDCSQAHGTICEDGNRTGNFGLISCFSLYPGKNLGAAGDAGIITTDDEQTYKKILKLRNLGSVEKYKHEIIGRNSRLDTIQSVILDEKLKKIDEWNNRRNEISTMYRRLIKNSEIFIQDEAPYCNKNTYHIFPILTSRRKEFMDYLSENDIPTIIHYPIPIEKTVAFEDQKIKNSKTLHFSEQLVSLPMHPFLTNDEVEYIINVVNNFKI